MFVQRSMPRVALALTLSLAVGPAKASDLVLQNTDSGLRIILGSESIRVTRGPSDFFSIFRPREKTKKKSRSGTVRRAPPVRVSPRPKGRDAAAVAGALAGLGAIQDTVAKQALDDGMGRLQGYQEAEAEHVAIAVRLTAAKELLATLGDEAAEARGPSVILRDLEALDLDSPSYAEDFAALKAELDAGEIRDMRRAALVVEIARLEPQVLATAERADAAFQLAANGRDLAPNTRKDLNHLLGLPDPISQ